jgi:hypothetical protein
VIEIPFVPANPLEQMLMATREGRITLKTFVDTFVTSDFFVPTSMPVEADGRGFDPMVFEVNNELLVTVFTAMDRIKKHTERFPYCLSMNGRAVLSLIAGKCGIVINPGWSVGLEIPMAGVTEILRDYPA